MNGIAFRALIFIILFILPSYVQSAANPTLYDSIYSELLACEGDTLLLGSNFDCIVANRGKLGDDYLGLMHVYLHQSELVSYNKGAMQVLDRIGLQHRYNEAYDSAIFYHQKSLEFALKLQDTTQLYYNYNNLGQVYRMQDLTVQAIKYFHLALKISDDVNDLKSSSRTMNTLGATYVVQQDYEKAMYYFKASAKMAKQLDDKRTLAYNYGSMGEVFLILGMNDSAMYYFSESKQLIVDLGGKRGMGVAEHLIGQAHFAMENINEAESYFKKALSIHVSENSKRYMAFCSAYLGKVKILQNQYDSAMWYLNSAHVIAESIHSFENLILINDAYFDLYKATNNWEQAVQVLKTSQSYKDSILSIANAKQIQALEIDYQTEKKEAKIILLSAQNEIKNQRMRLALMLIVILVLGIFMGIYVQNMRRKQAQLSHEKLQQQLMLSQMNPHFLFNALASIQGFMYKNETKKAAAYLGNFASLTRAILNNSTLEQVTLENEIETLRNYLELEKMRMQSAFDYSIIIPDEIDIEFIQRPPMLLQPFIENAIKHGFNKLENSGKLTIVFTELNDLISVEITDNGVGINSTLGKTSAEHRSMATQIFRRRMNILQKRYTNILDPQIIDISEPESGKTGTKVLIFMPIVNS